MILATSSKSVHLILDLFDFLRVRGKFNCVDKTPKAALVSQDDFIKALSSSESVLYVGKENDVTEDPDAQFVILYDKQLGVLVNNEEVLKHYNTMMDVTRQRHLVYQKACEYLTEIDPTKKNHGIQIGPPRKIINYFKHMRGLSLGSFLSDVIFTDQLYPVLEDDTLEKFEFKHLFYQKDKQGNETTIGVGVTDTLGRKWFILDQSFSRRDIRSLLHVAVERRYVKEILIVSSQERETEVSLIAPCSRSNDLPGLFKKLTKRLIEFSVDIDQVRFLPLTKDPVELKSHIWKYRRVQSEETEIVFGKTLDGKYQLYFLEEQTKFKFLTYYQEYLKNIEEFKLIESKHGYKIVEHLSSIRKLKSWFKSAKIDLFDVFIVEPSVNHRYMLLRVFRQMSNDVTIAYLYRDDETNNYYLMFNPEINSEPFTELYKSVRLSEKQTLSFASTQYANARDVEVKGLLTVTKGVLEVTKPHSIIDIYDNLIHVLTESVRNCRLSSKDVDELSDLASIIIKRKYIALQANA